MKALYNPKTIETDNGATENQANIYQFTWSHVKWNLKVGESKKFPDEVGEALLRTYPFLIEVTKSNYKEIEEKRTQKRFACKSCDFQSDLKPAFIAHIKTHKEVGGDADFLSGVEEAMPEGKFVKPTGIVQTPEQTAGIPSGGTKDNPAYDRDGVGFYGEGLQTDSE